MKNKKLLALPMLTLLIFSSALHSAARKKMPSTPKPIILADTEEAVISEIRSLLKHGTIPRMSFKDWCDSYVPKLLNSEKASVKNLGITLDNINKGDVANVSAFKVIPTFEKAVKEYDPKFKINIFIKPVIIARGTCWYLKKSKNIQ